MLSQFKSYSQSKKSPVLSQRPSVFCSPDDEDEEEESDISQFLQIKGKSRPVFFRFSLESKMAGTFLLHTPLAHLTCDWHIVIGVPVGNVLMACLKSLPQRTQTPGLLSTRWPLLWRRGDLSWKGRPRKTTRTILFSGECEGRFGSLYFAPFLKYFHLICFGLSLPFSFLFDQGSTDYLYYKKRVAEFRKDIVKPENSSNNGKMTL